MAGTVYTTRALAEELIGDDSKGSTRELRKFLRDDMGQGKAVVGKGGRYALELNKTQVKAMAKRFAAWQAKQEEEKAKRAELRNAPKMDNEDNTDDAPIEVIEDEAPTELEGPSDEEIAAMLADED